MCTDIFFVQKAFAKAAGKMTEKNCEYKRKLKKRISQNIRFTFLPQMENNDEAIGAIYDACV